MKTKPGTDLCFQIRFDPVLRLQNGMKIPYFGGQLPEKNKEKCRDKLPIWYRDKLPTPSTSSSKEINNYLKTKVRERGRERRERLYFTSMILREEKKA